MRKSPKKNTHGFGHLSSKSVKLTCTCAKNVELRLRNERLHHNSFFFPGILLTSSDIAGIAKLFFYLLWHLSLQSFPRLLKTWPSGDAAVHATCISTNGFLSLSLWKLWSMNEEGTLFSSAVTAYPTAACPLCELDLILPVN